MAELPFTRGGAEQSKSLDGSDLMARHGLTQQEAADCVMLPLQWMARMSARLSTGGAVSPVVAEVVAEAQKTITGYETRFGKHSDWDDMRIALGRAVVALGEFSIAAELLADVLEVDTMLVELDILMQRGIDDGHMTDQDSNRMLDELLNAFTRRGLGQTYIDAFRAAIAENMGLSPLAAQALDDLAGEIPADGSPDSWAFADRRLSPLASWEDILAVVADNTAWNKRVSPETRRGVAAHFAEHQQVIFIKPKIERKDVEHLKSCLKKQETASPPLAVWDRFRLIAAMSLYDAGAARFGHGVAITMADPAMIGAACHGLLAKHYDRDALLLAREIPDGLELGKVLYTGDWEDRSATDALILDMTVANKTNARRYDVGTRVGVAKGIVEVCLQRAAATTDESEAAAYAAQATAMQQRVDLLEHQATIGFITPPRAR